MLTYVPLPHAAAGAVGVAAALPMCDIRHGQSDVLLPLVGAVIAAAALAACIMACSMACYSQHDAKEEEDNAVAAVVHPDTESSRAPDHSLARL